MRRFICLVALVGLALILGCQTAPVRQKTSYGPPPPGYIKIRGEAVPNWKPSDMLPGLRSSSPLSWYSVGPKPITDEYWSGNDDASGRVVALAPHPTDPDTVYIGAASGGIWKTTDGGALWTTLTDELANLNHGALALDPSDPQVVYAGTGEYTTGSTGDGLFRSPDGGATWTRFATKAQVGSTCASVAVHPTDPLTVHVTGGSGYRRTTNGGASWTNGGFLGGSASALALNPVDPQIVFMGRHSDGVYRSTNGGTSFTRLTNGLPTTGIRRVLVALAPSNPDRVYTAFINSSSGLLGFYRSDDGGDSWTQMVNTPDFPYPQGWYDAFVGVDPTDEDTVYCGGVFPSYAVAGVIKSTNGGTNWTDITYGTFGEQLHPDQHAIAFGPDGTIWIGNDGGVWKSNNGGDSWVNCNDTLNVTQNYAIALHPSDPVQMMTGTQDNGTIGRDADVLQWPQILGGDGGFLAYDFLYPTRRYVTYVYLSVYRFVGTSSSNISGPWGSDDDPVNFIAPLVMDPNDRYTLLGGTNRVWRTNNAHTSASWSAISTSTVAGGGTLNAIAVAEGASDTIYTGSSTGSVYVTTDASTWNDRSTGLPSGQVSDIMIDPVDPAVAYVASHNTAGARVLRTENYGVSWSDVTGDLPSGISARALAVDWRFDPPHLYAGSGVGVYSSADGGATWIKDGLDLPNVNIGDLAVDLVEGTITAATYGRGTWRAALPVIPNFDDWPGCVTGPDAGPIDPGCEPWDFDLDDDVDVSDFSEFTIEYGVASP
ncbi:MAG TPA: hypothetical protein VM243_05350 [Phycisphaerae bacterium]|nr:hypothetical protein [Phycisphaerae bacterium]